MLLMCGSFCLLHKKLLPPSLLARLGCSWLLLSPSRPRASVYRVLDLARRDPPRPHASTSGHVPPALPMQSHDPSHFLPHLLPATACQQRPGPATTVPAALEGRIFALQHCSSGRQWPPGPCAPGAKWAGRGRAGLSLVNPWVSIVCSPLFPRRTLGG